MYTNRTHAISAYAVSSPGGVLSPYTYEVGPLGAQDILVEIAYCGICHSDLHLIRNDWKNSQYPLVPGHEIVGFIREKGSAVSHLAVGDRVGIGWQRGSCGHCEWCHTGEENLCAQSEATCLGHFGGFAREILVPSHFAFLIPEAISSAEAAPLFCGGITVFSPLLRCGVHATSRVGVVGIGGLGHLAVQFAHAFGCEVFAFSSSADKEQVCLLLGAHHYISTSHAENLLPYAETLDLLLVTSSLPLPWPLYLNLLRPKGALCVLGVPQEGMISFPLHAVIGGNKQVFGSNIGSPTHIRALLECAARHKIHPLIEVFPMAQASVALEKLAANQIRYRAVLKN